MQLPRTLVGRRVVIAIAFPADNDARGTDVYTYKLTVGRQYIKAYGEMMK